MLREQHARTEVTRSKEGQSVVQSSDWYLQLVPLVHARFVVVALRLVALFSPLFAQREELAYMYWLRDRHGWRLRRNILSADFSQ